MVFMPDSLDRARKPRRGDLVVVKEPKNFRICYYDCGKRWGSDCDPVWAVAVHLIRKVKRPKRNRASGNRKVDHLQDSLERLELLPEDEASGSSWKQRFTGPNARQTATNGRK